MKKKRESENDCDEEERNFIEKNHSESPLYARRDALASARYPLIFFYHITEEVHETYFWTGAGRRRILFTGQKTRER